MDGAADGPGNDDGGATGAGASHGSDDADGAPNGAAAPAGRPSGSRGQAIPAVSTTSNPLDVSPPLVSFWLFWAQARSRRLARISRFLSDLSRLRTIQYPIGSAGNSLGAPTHKTYKEAWVLFIDSDLKLAKQVLLVFDCLGRAAELGASVSLQTSTDRSYDLTGYAEGIGVERFMRRIPATSPYVAAQKFVCPLSR